MGDLFYNTDFLFLIYFSFFICTVIFSALINGIFLKFARTLGIRNNNDTVVRWDPNLKPALGGITFFICFLFSIACYSIIFPQGGTYIRDIQFIGLLLTAVLAFLMGLADDAYNTKPLLKLFVQISCGIIFIITNTKVQFFESSMINNAITIFWVVGIMNSINMLDNMDAITSSVGSIIILAAIAFILLQKDYSIEYLLQKDFSSLYLLMLVGVLASLIGFLFFNWHPSRLYMGDTGSQFLGIILAFVGITYFWNGSDVEGNKIVSKQIISGLLIFIIPLTDTVTVIINRLLKRQSPFVGGKDHTTHHLHYLGMTDRQIALCFTGVTLVSLMLTVFFINYIKTWNNNIVMLFSAYIAAIFGLLYYATKYKLKD
ncbi:MAG: undecaprenyl/decaprenyl-phosphate alpha-N-acetylglucosaminyl 1-phosphate transferase [Flavobacteriales bacterium]|nr:undecaprenyl/decaprenyl-phosphate alpha-N-acetylglucosaminyl 1-phosphate transferase [Flavobacteriales bacterium]